MQEIENWNSNLMLSSGGKHSLVLVEETCRCYPVSFLFLLLVMESKVLQPCKQQKDIKLQARHLKYALFPETLNRHKTRYCNCK